MRNCRPQRRRPSRRHLHRIEYAQFEVVREHRQMIRTRCANTNPGGNLAPRSWPSSLSQPAREHRPEQPTGRHDQSRRTREMVCAQGKFQATHVESDLRPGGKWMMRCDGCGGKPTMVAGEYRKIERPRLLVFTWLRGEQENEPETLVRWDLEEKDGITTVRLTHSGLTSESSR